MVTMDSVATAPNTATFQFRINPEIRERASINVEGLPFVVTQKSKSAKFNQAICRLMEEIEVGSMSSRESGWVSEEDIAENKNE